MTRPDTLVCLEIDSTDWKGDILVYASVSKVDTKSKFHIFLVLAVAAVGVRFSAPPYLWRCADTQTGKWHREENGV